MGARAMVLHEEGARLDSPGGEARAADAARSRLSFLGRCEASISLVAAIVVALGFHTTDAAEPHGGTAIAEPARGELKLNIAAQPISDALNEFARQSGLQVFFLASDQTRPLISTAISGSFDPKAALTRLLSNTGLSFKYLDARSVAIVDPAADTPRPPRQSSPENQPRADSATPTGDFVRIERTMQLKDDLPIHGSDVLI